MKDRYLVTLEIETYDGDPREWDWDKLSTGEDVIKIIESQWKGRVLPTSEGESLQERADRTNPYLLKTNERASNEREVNRADSSS
jgi:hypothetical protein